MALLVSLGQVAVVQAAALPILGSLAGGAVNHACSPGGIASLTGAGFTSEAPQSAAGFPLPTQLAGLQVTINGSAAPLFFASDSEVKFQCPILAAGTPLEIVVDGPGGNLQSPATSVMKPASPELLNPSAAAQAMPAGNPLTIYASGLGDSTVAVAAGTPAPANPPIPVQNQVRVVVGGAEITPALAALAPGTVGLSEVVVSLPSEVTRGPAVPLYLKVILPDGTVIESNEVTIAIE